MTWTVLKTGIRSRRRDRDRTRRLSAAVRVVHCPSETARPRWRVGGDVERHGKGDALIGLKPANPGTVELVVRDDLVALTACVFHITRALAVEVEGRT